MLSEVEMSNNLYVIFPEIVGLVLRKYRELRKATRAEVCGSLKVSEKHYSRYERGELTLDFNQAMMLCVDLGVGLDQFFKTIIKVGHVLDSYGIALELIPLKDKSLTRIQGDTLRKALDLWVFNNPEINPIKLQ